MSKLRDLLISAFNALYISSVLSVQKDFECSKNFKIEEFSFDLIKLDSVKLLRKNATTKPAIVETQYAINPCKELEAGNDRPREEQCAANTRICQKVFAYKNKSAILITVKELAKNTPQTYIIKDDEKFSEIVWVSKGETVDGIQYASTIRFSCSTEDVGPVVDSFNSSALEISWVSPSACPLDPKKPPLDPNPAPKPRGLSVFGTLMIVGAFVYLFGGIAFNYIVVGTRGLDLVPNLEFWQDFPGNFMALIHRLVTLVSGRRRGGYSSV